MTALYGGFVAIADSELASRARWNNSKGTWYAVVTIFREVAKHTSETAAEFYKKCNGRKAAVTAARELLAQHAAKFDVGSPSRRILSLMASGRLQAEPQRCFNLSG